MIREFALIPILPGREAEFEAVFAKRRLRVLAEEPETLTYDLFTSDVEPGLYIVNESFASDEAKQFHLKNSTDHEPMMACFNGKPVVHRLEPVSGAASPE
jgi:quinol monooxygenase YgiN